MSSTSAGSPGARAAVPASVVLVCGCLIAILTFGPRSTMGFFLTPMTSENGWSRETFALAIALQNLLWGMGQPFAGMIADRFGTWRVLSSGAALYALSLVLMAQTTDPVTLQFTAGVLLGLGIAGSAFFMVLAAFARLLPESMRSLAYGLGTAAGSMGQLLFAPLGLGFIDAYGYQNALLMLAASLVVVPLLAIPLKGKPAPTGGVGGRDQTIREALGEAFGHRSYWLLVAGFFVCGFHVAFVTTHLPPYIVDQGLDPSWGAWAIGLIGAFNVVGSLAAGRLSGIYPKRWVLSVIYFGRAVAYGLFWILPTSSTTVVLFAAAAGLLWLSTVPPTQGLVGVMFGTRYIAMLSGFVFFSHQVGAFLGVWLGGRLYDTTGSYDGVWLLGVFLGVFAGIVHLPIVERPVARLAPAE
ncbi:MFS transporter [Chthonobacter rhizosphaerae]|uniref:MFS transporter n=1 Tax=Chthonobacter rhizosphaerae TaxID=2735553 RepID=UPI0015EFBFDA|nr:MFS transporter [Chthonobacter rhizosphaerae]